MNFQINRVMRATTRLMAVSAICASVLTGLSNPAFADLEQVESKRIRIGRTEQPANSLDVSMEPTKSSYQVGEPIRFRVRGNRPFYLYLYSTDKDTGESVLLLPSKHQRSNKYPGRGSYTVPNRGVVIDATEEGHETITMVATTKYIDVKSAKLKAAGDFSVGKTKDLEEFFGDKGIRIRTNTGQPASGNGMVVRNIDLRIRGERFAYQDDDDDSQAEGSKDSVAFLSTSKSRYSMGEKLRVVFGANQKGWVHLYTIEPSGSISLLTSRKVDGKAIESVLARAESPLGRHTLVAAYTKGKDFDESILDDVADDRSSKALRLVSEDSATLAIKHFRITR